MATPFATVATKFLQRSGISKSTFHSYESTLLPLLQEYGRWPIDLISREMLSAYLQSLTHLACATHHRHQAVIQALFNFAVEQGYLKVNPIARLRRRKPDAAQGEHQTDEVVRYLSPEQLTLLYQVVQSDRRLHTLVNFLYRTGARVSEALALDLEQIDLLGRRCRVIGKGNKQRWLFWDEDTARSLEHYIEWERHPGVAALFTAKQYVSGQVSRMSYRTAHATWTKAIAHYPELSGVRLHDLRHTFATERVGLMQIEELKALLGHTRIDTTLRYQKVTSQRAEEVAKQALNKLQKV
jgi:integrase/recombinase XerD